MNIKIEQEELCGSWHAYFEIDGIPYHACAFSLDRLFDLVRSSVEWSADSAEQQLKGKSKSEWDVPFTHTFVHAL